MPWIAFPNNGQAAAAPRSEAESRKARGKLPAEAHKGRWPLSK